jgi:hypothetical protein
MPENSSFSQAGIINMRLSRIFRFAVPKLSNYGVKEILGVLMMHEVKATERRKGKILLLVAGAVL